MADERFPQYDLDASIEVARQIHERGGGTASADELAAYLNYKSANNGAFLSRMAAARMFGLIDGTAPALRITERALDIIRPAFPDAGTRARLDAFMGVPVYARFFKEAGNRDLPGVEGLRNLLARLGINEKQAGYALSRLLDSAEQAGLFKVAGGRSKMIVPTLTGGGSVETEAERENEPERPAGIRFSKMIEGALEALPAERSWDEDEFREWLDFFERALRVHYRLPRPRGDTR
jgi:hypothetical protein